MVRLTLLNKEMADVPVPVVITGVKYGLLYNWYAATDARNITSSDTWVVPTSTQRNTLMAYIGGFAIGGGKLKETGFTYWNSPNTGATNQYNLNVRGAGFRDPVYKTKNAGTTLMTSDDAGTNMRGLAVTNASAAATSPTVPKYYGWSIRLMRTATAEEQLLADGTACEHYVGNDLKIYRTVKIGTQVWIADNLAETKYRNGDAIPEVTDNAAWAALTTGALCAYDNDWSNVLL